MKEQGADSGNDDGVMSDEAHRCAWLSGPDQKRNPGDAKLYEHSGYSNMNSLPL